MVLCSIALTRRVRHFVYIARCADGTFYTGYALDPIHRISAHNAGRGARYTAPRRPVTLVYSEFFHDKSRALQREYRVKQLSRAEKQALIERTGRRRRHA